MLSRKRKQHERKEAQEAQRIVSKLTFSDFEPAAKRARLEAPAEAPVATEQLSFAFALSIECEMELASDEESASSTSSAASSPEHAAAFCLLDSLPRDLVMRILNWCWITDLCCLASVCKPLRALSGDPFLWADLFVRRWIPLSPRVDTVDWKLQYRDRDVKETAEWMSEVAEASSEDRVIWRQLSMQRRQHRRERNEFLIVEQWRRENPGLEAPADHVCSAAGCEWDVDGELFLCQLTGRVHICDEACREQVRLAGLPACPVSGQWASHRQQDDCDGDEDAQEELDDYDAGERGMLSTLGACFEFGYNCKDEESISFVLDHVNVR